MTWLWGVYVNENASTPAIPWVDYATDRVCREHDLLEHLETLDDTDTFDWQVLVNPQLLKPMLCDEVGRFVVGIFLILRIHKNPKLNQPATVSVLSASSVATPGSHLQGDQEKEDTEEDAVAFPEPFG